MARSYIPALRFVVRKVYRYATRWQTELQHSLTEGQYTCLVALIDASLECLTALGDPETEN